MPDLQIAYIEDEIGQYRKYRPILEACLSDPSYTVTFKHFKSSQSFAEFAKSHHPHVVIVDLKIGANENEGLRLIAKHKPDMPDSVFCLLSRERVTFNQFGNNFPNPDFIMSKVVLGGKWNRYHEYVRKEILDRVRRAFIDTIEFSKPFKEIFDELHSRESSPQKISEVEVRSILEQVAFAGHVTNSANSYKTVLLEPLPGGFSGALVLKIRVFRNGIDNIVGVVKISPLESAEMEFRNYEKYVKWTLPYTWRVEILGTARTRAFGAVCYSFVFDGQGSPHVLSDYFRSGDKKVIPLVGKTIFNPAKRTWYSNVRDTDQDLSDYFSSKPFFSDFKQIESRERKFFQIIETRCGTNTVIIEDETIAVDGTKFPRPMRLLFTNEWGTTKETICHGDMNANNVMFEEKSRTIAFIDFLGTGYNHIYRDFVSLESSVRLDWLAARSEPDFFALLEDEVSAVDLQSESVVNEYLKQCIAIRKMAESNFHPISMRQYYFGAAIHFWWLAVRFDDWSDEAYKRLCAGTLAALGHLESELT